MKKTKIIVPALAVLLLSTAASVSGTVAWFSMNASVKVDGMQVSTRVSSNLLIAVENREENYQDEIHQSRVGILEPASTINGRNFFYTTNASGNGKAKGEGANKYTEYSEAEVSNTDNPFTSDAVETNWTNAIENTGAGKTHLDGNFNIAYAFDGSDNDNRCYAYIDYAFYIKATSVADDAVLYMSKCNMLYKSGDAGTDADWTPLGASDYAWRVGLLAVPATANTDANDSNARIKTILGLPKALNQNQVNEEEVTVGTTDVDNFYNNPYGEGDKCSGKAAAGQKYYSAPSTTAQAVSSASAIANLANVDEAGSGTSAQGAKAQAAVNIDKGVTSYTRIIVRLWLEGEDITCTSSTYANLTKNWKLDLEFKLGTDSDGIQAIGSEA